MEEQCKQINNCEKLIWLHMPWLGCETQTTGKSERKMKYRYQSNDMHILSVIIIIVRYNYELLQFYKTVVGFSDF